MSEELKVITKKDHERFLFPDGGYQDLPNETTGDCAVISQDDDPSMFNVVGGEAVQKTSDELAEMATRKNAELFKQTADGYIIILDDHMNAKAKECGYDDIKSAVTYADEPAVPKFQNEGKALRAWRSLCYAKGYEMFDEAKASGVIPTADEFIEALPELVL